LLIIDLNYETSHRYTEIVLHRQLIEENDYSDSPIKQRSITSDGLINQFLRLKILKTRITFLTATDIINH